MEDRRKFLALAAAGAAGLALPGLANAKSLEGEANAQLHNLVRDNRAARAIYKQSKGQLVFPKIVKGGLVVGASYGKGVLYEGGQSVAHYNSVMGSVGFQAGVQAYGYVVFLITDKAIKYLHDSDGWEIGVGPTVVVVDDGAAKNISTSTIKDDAYAFIFNQRGLMAGVSLEGTKITKLK
jgi:lipid-binding SYLF domain-containing protein